MTDVVQRLWGFCNTLRHDGINYGDYIEQLTYLLVLKLADEKGVAVPKGFGWATPRPKPRPATIGAPKRSSANQW